MEGNSNPNGSTPFKMKGHTLPGINQNMDKTSLPDGRAGSSALQFDAFQSEDKQRETAIKESQENMEAGTATTYKAPLKATYVEEEKTGRSAGGVNYDEPAKGPNMPYAAPLKSNGPKGKENPKTEKNKPTDPNINPKTGLYYPKPGGAEGNKPEKPA